MRMEAISPFPVSHGPYLCHRPFAFSFKSVLRHYQTCQVLVVDVVLAGRSASVERNNLVGVALCSDRHRLSLTLPVRRKAAQLRLGERSRTGGAERPVGQLTVQDAHTTKSVVKSLRQVRTPFYGN
jgi:hypothetical protein